MYINSPFLQVLCFIRKTNQHPDAQVELPNGYARVMATDIQGSSFVETFEIPGARKVHGESFPLGIRPKDRVSSTDLDVALGYLKSLAANGAFDSKLAQRLRPRLKLNGNY